ncbi:hypothetical protein ebA5572 [Aromatoleum aromaticum EbN1]|uniref:Uncharacterized protein n=1 Tax=Aromatoleum aromaticum (strain DSM 19018 / LMG 30748 / EbN1) TaxID=76114 RepID=Q5P065_AROAE|nr:hypothetical protein ebA5572 [Aromatoleum aromaticum EbN1]
MTGRSASCSSTSGCADPVRARRNPRRAAARDPRAPAAHFARLRPERSAPAVPRPAQPSRIFTGIVILRSDHEVYESEWTDL